MIRNAKILGLALVAILAMSAVVASMASAFTEETKPGLFTASVGAAEQAKIDGEQTVPGKDRFTVNGLPLTCEVATLNGEPVKTKASPEEHVVSGSQVGPQSTDITLTPNYETCHVVVIGITKTVTVTTNGCAYVFDAKTTVTEVGFDRTAVVSIECPTGKQIEIHVYEEKEKEGKTICTYDIKPQNTLPGITLDNIINTTKEPKEANDVLATVNVTVPIINTIKSALCGQNENLNAVYTGEDTIRATNAAKEFVDASVSD